MQIQHRRSAIIQATGVAITNTNITATIAK